MRVAAFIAAVAALRLRDEPTLSPAQQGDAACQSMVGSYESHTTRVSVFLPHIFLNTPNDQHHAQGNVTSSTPCTCSGVLTFGENKIPYMYRYDMWTCTITWSTVPQIGSPMATPAGVWTRDGDCQGPPVCDPEHADETLQSLTMAQASEALALAKQAAEGAAPLVKRAEAAAQAFLDTGLPNIRARRAHRDTTRAVASVEEALAAAAAGEELAAPNTTEPESRTAQGLPADSVPASAVPTHVPLSASVPQTHVVTPAGSLIQRGRRGAAASKAWVSTGSGCDALGGEYEQETTILEVHNGSVYALANARGPHASGEITSETECTCSGELDYGDLGIFEFKYDLHTCGLSWFDPPTLEVPHSVEGNVWTKDGGCVTAAKCAPHDEMPTGIKIVNTGAVALKAEITAIKAAVALTLVSVAAQALTKEAAAEIPKHPDHKEALLKSVTEMQAVVGEVLAPARLAFQCLASINPRAVQPARTAIQTAVQMTELLKGQVAALQ
mmetsp:Transcript_4532/g.10633  ORF Transcript_4532/g.10633 Transcript_4532/m.10633 type:complete len:499 (+) Transcript_4532:57-1553(+)